MKKHTRNYAMAVAVAMVPVFRYIDDQFPSLSVVLCIAVCLYFLLRGLYYHLQRSEAGRSFLRKVPFLHIPNNDQE